MNEETAKRSSIEAKQKTATENPGRRRALGTLGAFGAAAVTAHAPARAEEPNAPLELHRVVVQSARPPVRRTLDGLVGYSPRS
jgi:hypothetical protein